MSLTKEDYEWLAIQRSHLNLSDLNEMGFFGNVWVRSHTYRKAGDTNAGGHYHRFDHVTLLVKGAIRVEVEGCEPKRFVAPTFVIIEKDKKHKVTALEDDTVYYCVFALRDIDGNVTDIYSGNNDPYHSVSDEDFKNIKQVEALEQATVLTDR